MHGRLSRLGPRVAAAQPVPLDKARTSRRGANFVHTATAPWPSSCSG
jgi:hypothetical protein